MRSRSAVFSANERSKGEWTGTSLSPLPFSFPFHSPFDLSFDPGKFWGSFRVTAVWGWRGLQGTFQLQATRRSSCDTGKLALATWSTSSNKELKVSTLFLDARHAGNRRQQRNTRALFRMKINSSWVTLCFVCRRPRFDLFLFQIAGLEKSFQ